MGDEAESPSPDPREQGVADAAAGRDPIGPTDESWTDEDWSAYLESYWKQRRGMEPARAPAPWPVALVRIAAETALWTGTAHASRRWRPVLWAGTWGVQRLTEEAERARARRLGLRSAAEQPRVPVRLTVPPAGRSALVCVPFPAGTFVASVLTALAIGLVRRLRYRRHDRRRLEVPQSWESFLARLLCAEIMRRRDWRQAGGPTPK